MKKCFEIERIKFCNLSKIFKFPEIDTGWAAEKKDAAYEEQRQQQQKAAEEVSTGGATKCVDRFYVQLRGTQQIANAKGAAKERSSLRQREEET